LWDGVIAATEEKVSLAMIGHARLANKHLLTVGLVLPVPDSEYVKGHQLHETSWSARFNVRAIELADKAKLGLLIMHSHGPEAVPALSTIDRQDGERLCSAFRTAIPDHPHGTVVVGKNGLVSGLVWLPGEKTPSRVEESKWVSDPTKVVPPAPARRGFRDHMYLRQKILLGEEGQRILSSSTVGVIGLGGGGSHVVQQLSLLGIGRLVLVDNDTVEDTNRHRLIGSSPKDAAKDVKKTEVMKRLVDHSNPHVRVSTCVDRFPSDRAVAALKECDVIVGCVDTLTTRKEIQSFAWRYLIPYIDIGLLIVPETSEAGRAKTVSGQVYDLIPGEACLWCAQLITLAALERETGGQGPTYIERTDQRAQVVSFNGVLGSAAVSEVLHILTGYSSRERVPNALQFDGSAGTLMPVALERKNDCSVCNFELGRGDPRW
jgi:molybdopterin-synthase adenylyltransferase